MRQQTTSSTTSRPADILALVSRLMGHYWLPTEPEPVRRAQLEDWLEDLIEFSTAAVAAACREWRQTKSKRPTPADIRKLCIVSQNRRRETEAKALPPPVRQPEPEPEPMSEEDRAYCILLAEKEIRRLKRIPADKPTGYGVELVRKERTYTAEEMRRARIALGIEQPQQQAAE